MTSEDSSTQSVVDKTHWVYRRFEERRRAEVTRLITDEIVAEHERQPIGHHSADLQRILNCLRRGPWARRYALLCTKPHREWRLALLSGQRGDPPLLLDEKPFGSESKAHHAVFLRRIAELQLVNHHDYTDYPRIQRQD